MMKIKKVFVVLLLCWLVCITCKVESIGKSNVNDNIKSANVIKDTIIQIEQNTIETRFLPPKGFHRIKADDNTFADYLRHLPLKKSGSFVKYYNGDSKPNHNVYEAVVYQTIGQKDLHQCADAIIRLRAEYFWKKQQYDSILFHLTNGDLIPYEKWKNGQRIKVEGNKTKWVNKTSLSNDYATFWSYLEFIFTYAGTASLEKEMLAIPISSMKIGDVFIKGGFPGHAVMVLDMAIHEETKEKVYMLGQSYMPAQEFHVLANNNDSELSPWYKLDKNSSISTPEWRFTSEQLKTWK